VVFWFGISGVSRSLSHQFVRHRIGISFEQQSQRYVRYKENRLEYVTPKTWDKAPGMRDEYDRLMREITRVYQLALEKGIPAEDARFVLPNATPTNFQVMVNFAELLHIADLRLCWRAQWEIRHMVALMRREIVKAIPEIGVYLQPKCGDRRTGYCDEPLKEWEACPIGKVRPHKEQIFQIFREYKAGNLVPLGETDLRKVQHPLIVLLLLTAGASLRVTPVAIWLLVPFVLFRVSGKIAGGWLASRYGRAFVPTDLGTALIWPGVVGIAFALNFEQVAPPVAGGAVLTAVALGGIASELLALLVAPIPKSR